MASAFERAAQMSSKFSKGNKIHSGSSPSVHFVLFLPLFCTFPPCINCVHMGRDTARSASPVPQFNSSTSAHPFAVLSPSLLLSLLPQLALSLSLPFSQAQEARKKPPEMREETLATLRMKFKERKAIPRSPTSSLFASFSLSSSYLFQN